MAELEQARKLALKEKQASAAVTATMGNRSENYGIEDDGPSLMQGFGQLSVCYRPGQGQGIMVGTADTDQIISAFAKGTTFAGMRVERKSWTSSIIQDTERVMHPVTIPWRGFCS